MANLPRIRSAKEAASELRKLDPGTKFCEDHIRYLMRSGAVPMITAGCRQFVNLDTLIEYLAEHPTLDLQGQQQEQDVQQGFHGRRILTLNSRVSRLKPRTTSVYVSSGSLSSAVSMRTVRLSPGIRQRKLSV